MAGLDNRNRLLQPLPWPPLRPQNSLADLARSGINALMPQPALAQPIQINWSNQLRPFELHRIGTVFNPVPGVYIFCRDIGFGQWQSLYVGEASSFHERLTDQLQHHHQIGNVLRFGATHISALTIFGDRSIRLDVETHLRNLLNPPCNQQ